MIVRNGQTLLWQEPEAQTPNLGGRAVVRLEAGATVKGHHFQEAKVWVGNGTFYFHPVAKDWASGVKLEDLVKGAGARGVTIIWDGHTND